jgi:hypothetical protein
MYYEHDIIYNVSHLSIDKKKELLLDAKEKSYQWFIDKHDERGIRQRIKYARFNTILKLLDNKSHFVFIERGGYVDDINSKRKKWLNNFIIETGFCTMGRNGGDYFLFINLDKKHLNYFIGKYNLLLL